MKVYSYNLMSFYKSGWVRGILLSIVLIYVGKMFADQLCMVDFSEVNISKFFLLLSLFFEILTRFFIGLGYHHLLKGFDIHLPIMIPVSVSWVSFLGKYLPGKIALVGSAIYLLSKYNVRMTVAAIVPVLNIMMTIIVAFVLSIPLLGNRSLFFLVFAFLVFSIIVSKIVFGKSTWVKLKVNNALERIGLARMPKNAVKQLSISLFMVLLQCCCAGISTWTLSRALVPLDLSLLGIFISITLFSGVMGLLSFFSPAGIGVRDGAFLLTLGPILGSENAAIITILLRMIQIFVDLGTAGIGALYLRIISKP